MSSLANNNPLINDDLKPTTDAQRHWRMWDFAALWVGMVVCVPTYTMASSMLDQGFTWQMAIWLVFLANCIVLIPMILLGRAGARYGIPFPVLARASWCWRLGVGRPRPHRLRRPRPLRPSSRRSSTSYSSSRRTDRSTTISGRFRGPRARRAG